MSADSLTRAHFHASKISTDHGVRFVAIYLTIFSQFFSCNDAFSKHRSGRAIITTGPLTQYYRKHNTTVIFTSCVNFYANIQVGPEAAVH